MENTNKQTVNSSNSIAEGLTLVFGKWNSDVLLMITCLHMHWTTPLLSRCPSLNKYRGGQTRNSTNWPVWVNCLYRVLSQISPGFTDHVITRGGSWTFMSQHSSTALVINPAQEDCWASLSAVRPSGVSLKN